MSTIIIGVDLAKSVFSLCEVDSYGHVRVGHIDSKDRLRKCSLTIVAARTARSTQHAENSTTPSPAAARKPRAKASCGRD